MKKLTMTLAAAMALMFVTFTASAHEFKVAVVNMQKIYQASPQLDKINASLKKQFAPRQQAILASQKKLQGEIASFQKNQAVLSKADISKKEAQITSDEKSLRQKQLSFQKEYMAARSKAYRTIGDEIKDIINKIANKKGFDFVFATETLPYANTNYDVTQDVIKALLKS